ncbi:uncharacterized protein OCT59_021409 [Rhizophagus irregularis]|uniref:uncharacterized protein n=1 Tax=Rhizophagus irregularis TaxID=588596 RepID=UPI0033166174|nr:hypothetical protein OCT59_021409 [Rhizophagus irregularis]
MSNILYKNQHQLKQKPIYDYTVFKMMLETTDEQLIRFLNELYEGTNPANKSEKTNNSNKKKLVSLCYFLASINNKYINGIKVDIGSYLQTSGASAASIDTLANIGLSVLRKTVDRQKKVISDEHEQSVDNYCLQNIEKMFVLNIDDYHNIHRRTTLSLLETHNIFHFVTILLNSNPNISKIPYYSNNISLHNPKGIDFKLIIEKFENHFMNQIGKSYYEQNELWKQFLIEDSYENRIKNLNVHNYDGRIQKHQELRSLNNSKLVDFILHPLHSIKDYIECSNVLFKDAEYRMMIDLLDNSIPLTLDIYAVLFRSGYFEGYLKGVVRIWVLFQRLRRRNYNKAPLVFLSDVFYWELNNHPMSDTLKNNLPIFNDYFVENFHSSIRNQTVESNNALQIIQKAKIIDAERYNNSFKESFINSRNLTISQDKLNYLEKKVSLFLFSLFDKIYHNIGNTIQIDNIKYPSFILPNSSDSIVLICGHGFHKECLALYNGKCSHCFNYLSFGIQKNINTLTARLTTALKDNEIPLVEEEMNDSLDENNDEDMQNILERLEQNIDNQFEILYQKWSDYDSL